jgi:hypothetical protein
MTDSDVGSAGYISSTSSSSSSLQQPPPAKKARNLTEEVAKNFDANRADDRKAMSKNTQRSMLAEQSPVLKTQNSVPEFANLT